jgi:hypothetical protein
MSDNAVLAQICEELVSVHQVHTILLYGSRADGSAGDDSDYDIAAFGPVAEAFRIARQVGAAYLDVWVYPEACLAEATEESLRLRGSRIVMQRARDGEAHLAKVDALFRRGPTPLSANEKEARRVWAHKMLARIARGDPEGNYRRVWLLQALLEDYFHRRGLWFEGPKKSLRWLEQSDPPAYLAFCVALEPAASSQAIAALVHLLAGQRAA